MEKDLNFKEIKNEINKKLQEFAAKDIEPKYIILGRYSYYIVKDHIIRYEDKDFQAFGNKITKRPQNIFFKELKIIEFPHNEGEGQIKKEHQKVELVGN